MSEMSRAVRLQIEEHSRDYTLKGLPTGILADYVQILGALYFDLKEELERRG